MRKPSVIYLRENGSFVIKNPLNVVVDDQGKFSLTTEHLDFPFPEWAGTDQGQRMINGTLDRVFVISDDKYSINNKE